MVDTDEIIAELSKKMLFRFPNLSSDIKLFGPDTVITTISWCTEAQKNRVGANIAKWLKEYPQIKKYAVRVKVI